MNFLMFIMASGIARGCVCPHDHDSSDGVAQDGGPNSNNSLTETCSLGHKLIIWTR